MAGRGRVCPTRRGVAVRSARSAGTVRIAERLFEWIGFLFKSGARDGIRSKRRSLHFGSLVGRFVFVGRTGC